MEVICIFRYEWRFTYGKIYEDLSHNRIRPREDEYCIKSDDGFIRWEIRKTF